MNKTYLKELSSVKLLSAWGAWQTDYLRKLGYQRVKYNDNSVTRANAVSDEDLMIIDKVLAEIKQDNADNFNVLYWRFALKENYRQITQRLRKKSPKVAGQKIEESIGEFTNKLKEIL